MKDRLIELLRSTPPTRLNCVGRMVGKTYTTLSGVANHLIANGVIVHGDAEWKWISDDDVMCATCGTVFNSHDNADAGTRLWKFCPNCGAKMKGASNEQ